MVRRRGRKGANMTRLRLVPKSEIGRRRHAGQRRVKAPIAPPRLVALRVPTGHVPFFLLQLKSPAFSASRKVSAAVKSISPLPAAGRGGEGSEGNAPSSHAKNALQSRSKIGATITDERGNPVPSAGVVAKEVSGELGFPVQEVKIRK